jgi:hypothetical protein|tara:strand:- start:2931 stop:3314 length:384 start_codon:yes stop_codon:yes gene_type:complete
MILYDITDEFATEFPMQLPIPGQPLRIVYNHNGIVSALTAMVQDDGTAEIIIYATDGYKLQTASNSAHHHFSALTANKHKYAQKIGASKFSITLQRTGKDSFMKKRFPEWELVGHTDLDYPIMELTL